MVRILEQDHRFARLQTPLGKDVLVLTALDGDEGINLDFTWRIECLLNYGEDIQAADLIGQPCHVALDTAGGETRYFHGLCIEVRYCGQEGDYARYRLTLAPWTWLLTRERASEIFHEKSVRDIVQQVFSDRGFSDVRFQLSKTYEPIPYCVQYQETTRNFVWRLLEKYGLFTYFEFTETKHTLVITDDLTALPDAYSQIRFQNRSESGIHDERIFTWEAENRLRTAIVEVDDYNYDKPNTALEKTGQPPDSPSHAHKTLTQTRYPTGHSDPAGGQLLADVLVAIERGDAERKFATGYAPLVRAGSVLTLADHPRQGENAAHVAVGATHSITVNRVATGDGPEDRYDGQYTVVDKARPFKAPQTAAWPQIAGAQTAEVIRAKSAPGDEEIDVDDQGRILVRFHWNDRKAASDKCSCRVRVAQMWAGAQWGSVWIPRVGMEVVVEFLEGDPDRPLVTGTVYNANNKPPVQMPANKTQSTIKSNASKGGGGFNELRFEDKKGAEEIYVHAERDRTVDVLHDDTLTITSDQTTTIKKGDQKTTISSGNQNTTISSGNQKTKIAAGAGDVSATKKYTIKVGASKIEMTPQKITIKAPQVEIEGSMTLKTKGGIQATHEAGAQLTVKGGIVMIN